MEMTKGIKNYLSAEIAVKKRKRIAEKAKS